MKSALLARVAGAAVGIVLLTGCGTSRRAQLERVAKDWCETIRASQVIPVYPLTEDLQPGDVFLVQVPVDKQQQVYRERGFLPLDNHLLRLDPTGYPEFYDSNFPLPQDANMPEFWLRPKSEADKGWERAPNAAFPTYSFSVNSAQGFNLAIPISGVPVGMSMLATNSANGFVNIDDARTIGVDMMSMHAQLEAYVNDHPDVRAMLANFGCRPGEAPRNFLRVVSRVYATGKLEVLINDASTFGAGLDAGAARPVDLFIPRAPDGVEDTQASARENYLTGMGHLNNMGGTTGAPTHRSGEDSGLTPKELADNEAARKEARDAEVKKREEALKAAKDGHKTDQDEAEKSQAYKDWVAATKEREQSEESLRTKTRERRALEKVIHDPAATPEARAEATSKIEQARADENAARETLKSKRAVESEKRGAFNATAEATKARKSKAALGEAQSAVDAIKGFAPGGSVRFSAASSRSISMDETFDPPLIIGYLGFDVGILPGGGLGRPIPTHAVVDPQLGVNLTGEQKFVRGAYETEGVRAMYPIILADAATSSVARSIQRSLDDLADRIPLNFPRVAYARDGNGKPIPGQAELRPHPRGRTTFDDYLNYRDDRQNGLNLLRAHGDGLALTVHAAGGGSHVATAEEVRSLIEKQFTEPRGESRAYAAAIRTMFEYYAASRGQQ